MATSATKKPDATTWYALGSIHHDGRVYGAGAPFPAPDQSATEEQIAALRACGVLSSVPPVEDQEQPAG